MSNSARLLVDCGNSVVKGRFAGASQVTRWSPNESWPEQWRALDHITYIASSVAHARAFLAAVQEYCGDIPCEPLTVDADRFDLYSGFGHDRLCAGVAAVRDAQCDVIVVDFGTATTLTAWRCLEAQARLEGGLIAPSAAACGYGLHQLAPGLPQVDSSVAHVKPVACRDTRASVQAALSIGFTGMVAACLRALQDETQIELVYVTGGGINADQVCDAISHGLYHPTLVLDGLADLCSPHSELP